LVKEGDEQKLLSHKPKKDQAAAGKRVSEVSGPSRFDRKQKSN
jgi:hypothetical protein